MKAKILIILSILFMFCTTAYGKDIGFPRDIYPSTQDQMASTNNGGVSECQVFEIGKMADVGGIGTFQWKSLSGATDITGISVFFRASNVNTDEAWALTEQIPVILDENTLTGNTNWAKTFAIPDTYFLRFEFECVSSSTAYGVTPYGIVHFRSGGDWRPHMPIIIGTEYLAINANSGVSSLTVPDGTRSTCIMFQGDTVRSRSDGTDPTTVEGTVWDEGDAWIIDGNKTGEAGDVKFTMSSGGSGTTISVIHKN